MYLELIVRVTVVVTFAAILTSLFVILFAL
jgi:hypothetical protein